MFEEIIKNLREKKGMSQRELGEYLGVTQQAVGRWEKGQALPDTNTMILLADFFGVTTDELLGRDKKTYSGILSKDHPDPEIAELLKNAGIEKLKLTKDATLEDIKLGMELVKTIRKEHGLNDK